MAKGNECSGQAFLDAIEGKNIEDVRENKIETLRQMGESAWCKSGDTMPKPCDRALYCALVTAGLATISNTTRSKGEMTYMTNLARESLARERS